VHWGPTNPHQRITEELNVPGSVFWEEFGMIP
jgi:hypothetical protein